MGDKGPTTVDGVALGPNGAFENDRTVRYQVAATPSRSRPSVADGQSPPDTVSASRNRALARLSWCRVS